MYLFYKMRALLFLVLIIPIISKSQDCPTLDRFRSFHGIAFGKPLPDDIKEYFWVDSSKFESDGIVKYSTYSFKGDSIPQSPFASWFKMGEDFEKMEFRCGLDDKVIEISLENFLPVFVKSKPTATAPTEFFKNVVKELKSLFGKPTVANKKYSKGNIELYGYSWECDVISVGIMCLYDSGVVNYTLVISDTNLMKENKLNMYR